MPPVVLVGLTALAAGIALRRPARAGLPVLVGAVILIPATLVVPNGITGLATVHRVIMLAVLVGLLLAAKRGDVPREAFRLTPVHAAFGIFLVVTIALGIGLAPAGIPLLVAFTDWVRWFDQGLFFVVALALVRSEPDLGRVLRVIAATFGVAVAIAAIEQLTGSSWGQWLFSRLPSQQATDAAQALVFRAGQVRVRAGAEFALESAWVMLALLPVVLLAVRHRAERIAVLQVAAVLGIGAVAVYWTVSRSASVLLPVVAIAVVAATRDRRVLGAVSLVLTAGFVAVLAWPRLLSPLGIDVDPGAAAVRTERLPDIMALAAQRPIRGLGLGALQSLGFPVTDASYLLVYAELGVIGFALLLVALGVAVGATARSLLTPPSPERAVAAVAAVGATTLVMGALVYDGLHVLGSARTFWLLVTLGLVATERSVGRLGWGRGGGWRWRVALPLAALGAGVAITSVVPAAQVTHLQFFAVPVEDEVAPFDPVTHGTTLLNTVCGAVDSSGGTFAGATVECRDRLRGAGVGELRVVAEDAAAVDEAVRQVTDLARTRVGVPAFRTVVQTPTRATQPTWARTAEVWLPALALGAAVFVPARRRREAEDPRRPTTSATPLLDDPSARAPGASSAGASSVGAGVAVEASEGVDPGPRRGPGRV
jgi:hypothetical protein